MPQTAKTPAADSLVLHNGKVAVPLKPGEVNVFKAAAGAHYRVLAYRGAEEQMLDNVIARRHGNNLKLQYADGTELTLQEYYGVCASGQSCDVRLPGENGRVNKLLDGTGGTPLGDGSTLVYAHGAPDLLIPMASDNGALRTALATTGGTELSYPAQAPAGAAASGTAASAASAASAIGGVSGGMLGAIAGGVGLALAAAGGGGGGGKSGGVGPGVGTGGTGTPADTVAPTVTSVALSAGSHNGYLKAGDVVTATVTMSEATTVGGKPQLALDIGGTTVMATYLSGSGSNVLRFAYTVQAGQVDADGIAVAGNGLALNGGTLADAAGNAANVSHAAVAANEAYKVETLPPTASVTSPPILDNKPVVVHSSKPGTAYMVHSNVDVVDLSSITGAAATLWNSGAVANGDASIATDRLADGNYRVYTADAAGNLSSSAADTVVIDRHAPTVAGIALTDATGARNGTLNAGDVVYATVTMSENTIVTGKPQLALQIGGTTVLAEYQSGSGTNALVFAYAIRPGQTDADGIAVPANGLALNDGAMADALAHAASLGHGAVASNNAYLVDTTAPTVQSVRIHSATGAQNGQLNAGDVITVAVGMSESTTVTGVPQVALDIGGKTVRANYASGSGSATLLFTYTVSATDADSNGVGIAASSISLNDGSLADAGGNTAVLGHAAVADNELFKVDNETPRVTGVNIASATGIQNGVLNSSSVVDVAVDLSEAVLVTGAPTLALKVGDSTVQAAYKSGSGTSKLVFSYHILAGQGDSNGIAIPADGIALNNGGIADLAGNSARLTYAAVADNGSYLVDTRSPTLTTVTFAGASGAEGNLLNTGDTVTVQVTLNESVFVTGTPRLALNVGGATVQAQYTAGSGSNTLLFSYTVGSGLTDTNGIAIPANALNLNGGTIRNAVGEQVVLSHAAVADNIAYVVDTSAPVASVTAATISNGSIAIARSTETGTAYLVSTALQPASVGAITSAPGNQWNSVAIGTANTDTALPAAGLPVGTYKVYTADQAGNLSVASSSTVTINAALPAVSSVAITSASGARGNYLNADDKVNVTVTTSTIANVFGVPQLQVKVGDTQVAATYLSGTGTTSLVFTATIPGGATDANGISIDGSSISLPGGSTIRTSGGVDLDLSFEPVPDAGGYRVDTIVPTVIADAGTYSSNSATKKSVVVKGSESGTAYLVNSLINVTDLASIESGAAENTQRKSVALPANFAEVPLPVAGLVDGAYKLYAVDDAGNLSTAVTGINVDNTAPTVTVTPIAMRANDTITVQSNEAGKAYLVSASIQANPVAITSASTNVMTSLTVAANTPVAITAKNGATPLQDGDYKIYVIDNAGNLSTGSGIIKVDNQVPTVTNVRITAATGAAGNWLNANDTVTATVTMSEAVTVTGVPTLSLDVGGTIVQASYAPSTSTSTALTFTYLVEGGRNDANGIGIVADSLALGGGNIADGASNNASLAHPAAGDNSAYRVDTVKPTAGVTAATITTNQSATVTSNEVGTAYLVLQSFDVSGGVASFTPGTSSQWNSVEINTPGAATPLSASGLIGGTYVVYTADAAGNLSDATGATVTVNVVAFAPFAGDTVGAARPAAPTMPAADATPPGLVGGHLLDSGGLAYDPVSASMLRAAHAEADAIAVAPGELGLRLADVLEPAAPVLGGAGMADAAESMPFAPAVAASHAVLEWHRHMADSSAYAPLPPVI